MESNTDSNTVCSYNQDFLNSPPQQIAVTSSSRIQVGNSLSYQAPVTFNVDVMNMQGLSFS